MKKKATLPILVLSTLAGAIEGLLLFYHYQSVNDAEQLRRLSYFLFSGLGLGVACTYIFEAKSQLKLWVLPLAIVAVAGQLILLYLAGCLVFSEIR